MPFDLVTYFRAQAYNNAWANHRLLQACKRLQEGELGAERTSFFPSIAKTLNHLLTVDWYYVSALEGDCVGYAAFDPQFPFDRLEDIDREQRAIDRRLVAVCEGLDADAVSKPVRMPRRDRVQVEEAGRVLLHLFEHQIHHRGQVHAMLSGTTVKPPQLDEFFLADEAPIRREDFEALGFSEEKIWR